MSPISSSRVRPRLPVSVPVLRRLRAREVDLEPRPDETADVFEARMETALMALFRDERIEEHFQALYDYARGALLDWILGLCSDRGRSADPLEVLQDAFVNAYRYASGFRDDEPRSFRVWSRTIAGNLVRRQASTRARGAWSALPEGGDEPVDRHCGPSDEASEREEVRITAAAWLYVLLQYAAAYEQLSPRDRLALELIEVQGLSYAEAGRRLRVGMSNMKMIMFRSRRRIRVLIERQLASRFDLAPLQPRLAG